MNRWLQSKEYTCQHCGARYVHDRAYEHSLFRCPRREDRMLSKSVNLLRKGNA